MFILTRQKDGEILRTLIEPENATSSPVILALSNGYLHASVETESYQFTLLPRLNDGIYHFIRVEISSRQMKVIVDNTT